MHREISSVYREGRLFLYLERLSFKVLMMSRLVLLSVLLYLVPVTADDMTFPIGVPHIAGLREIQHFGVSAVLIPEVTRLRQQFIDAVQNAQTVPCISTSPPDREKCSSCMMNECLQRAQHICSTNRYFQAEAMIEHFISELLPDLMIHEVINLSADDAMIRYDELLKEAHPARNKRASDIKPPFCEEFRKNHTACSFFLHKCPDCAASCSDAVFVRAMDAKNRFENAVHGLVNTYSVEQPKQSYNHPVERPAMEFHQPIPKARDSEESQASISNMSPIRSPSLAHRNTGGTGISPLQERMSRERLSSGQYHADSQSERRPSSNVFYPKDVSLYELLSMPMLPKHESDTLASEVEEPEVEKSTTLVTGELPSAVLQEQPSVNVETEDASALGIGKMQFASEAQITTPAVSQTTESPSDHDETEDVSVLGNVLMQLVSQVKITTPTVSPTTESQSDNVETAEVSMLGNDKMQFDSEGRITTPAVSQMTESSSDNVETEEVSMLGNDKMQSEAQITTPVVSQTTESPSDNVETEEVSMLGIDKMQIDSEAQITTPEVSPTTELSSDNAETEDISAIGNDALLLVSEPKITTPVVSQTTESSSDNTEHEDVSAIGNDELLLVSEPKITTPVVSPTTESTSDIAETQDVSAIGNADLYLSEAKITTPVVLPATESPSEKITTETSASRTLSSHHPEDQVSTTLSTTMESTVKITTSRSQRRPPPSNNSNRVSNTNRQSRIHQGEMKSNVGSDRASAAQSVDENSPTAAPTPKATTPRSQRRPPTTKTVQTLSMDKHPTTPTPTIKTTTSRSQRVQQKSKYSISDHRTTPAPTIRTTTPRSQRVPQKSKHSNRGSESRVSTNRKPSSGKPSEQNNSGKVKVKDRVSNFLYPGEIPESRRNPWIGPGQGSNPWETGSKKSTQLMVGSNQPSSKTAVDDKPPESQSTPHRASHNERPVPKYLGSSSDSGTRTYNPPHYYPSVREPSYYNPFSHNPFNYDPPIYGSSNYNPPSHGYSNYNPSGYRYSNYNPSSLSSSNYNPSSHNPSKYNPSNYSPSHYYPFNMNPPKRGSLRDIPAGDKKEAMERSDGTPLASSTHALQLSKSNQSPPTARARSSNPSLLCVYCEMERQVSKNQFSPASHQFGLSLGPTNNFRLNARTG